MQPAWDFAKAHNVTVWCGEFGIARWANGAELSTLAGLIIHFENGNQWI